MISNFVHVEIGVTDLDLAKSFFEKIFSWKIYSQKGLEDYLIFQIDNSAELMGGGLRLTPERASTGTTILYIKTTDINKSLQEILSMDGKIILEKTQLPASLGYIGRFEDPFGNVFGLWNEE